MISPRPHRYVSYMYVTIALVVLIASIGVCEAEEPVANDMRQLSNKFQIDISTSSSSNSDSVILVSIENGARISRSRILNANDVNVRIPSSLRSVGGVTFKYFYRDASNSSQVSEQWSSYDKIKPFTLLAGSKDSIKSLQLVGMHQMTITIVGSLGIQVGPSLTTRWDVVNDSAPSSPTPFPSRATIDLPSASSTDSPVNLPIFPPPNVNVIGELQIWHKITIVFNYGPSTSETAVPNPFTDYRLDLTFRNENTGTVITVPGFYAADGNAQETSATSGQVWHCHFAPIEVGIWSWQASFLTGANVAMADAGNAIGSTVSPIHGESGSFVVEPSNKSGVDLRGKGVLRYVKGKHHLQFAGTGEWFLKAGVDSPENFLAYDDFDNTPDNGQRRKSWSDHSIDFIRGDPTWAGGKGKGIIGAINYLSAQGMKAFSFLTMNIDGDDNNVYPYVDPSNRLRFDVSKLAQWEVVLEHGTRKGMFLHFKTQERENDQLLDQGNLGDERKLYYRELIARFGHHLALNWNIGEENTNTAEQQKQFADWFKLLDPYRHPIVLHSGPYEQDTFYGPLYGYESYDGASLQSYARDVFRDTLAIIKSSSAAGRPWVVANDEQGDADLGVVPDRVDSGHDIIRRDVLWGNIMAGGAGVEYYFGYSYENSDLTCEDFRSRANMWVQSRYALEFFSLNNIPFQDMVNANSRVSNDNWCLMERPMGRVIVIYLRFGGTASINLMGLGNSPNENLVMTIHWYDPRNGGALQLGSVTSLQLGGAIQELGSAPRNSQDDWIVLLRCSNGC